MPLAMIDSLNPAGRLAPFTVGNASISKTQPNIFAFNFINLVFWKRQSLLTAQEKAQERHRTRVAIPEGEHNSISANVSYGANTPGVLHNAPGVWPSSATATRNVLF